MSLHAPFVKDAKSVYRHRGFFCSNCATHSMIFGGGADFIACPFCNNPGPIRKEWDHIVTESTHVQDWAEPVDSIDAGTPSQVPSQSPV